MKKGREGLKSREGEVNCIIAFWGWTRRDVAYLANRSLLSFLYDMKRIFFWAEPPRKKSLVYFGEMQNMRHPHFLSEGLIL
jgi:hypothetical protein